MKKIFAVSLLASLFFICSACDKAPQITFPNESSGTEKIFRIERYTRILGNPTLYIVCKDIKIDYNRNTLTVIGLIGLTGDKGFEYSWISESVKIQDGNLVLKVDDLRFYEIKIIPAHDKK